MIIACLVLVLGLWIVLPTPAQRTGAYGGVEAGQPGEKRIRAGPGLNAWLEKLPLIPGSAGTSGGDPLETAADVDLFAACLESGLSIRDATGVVARVAHPEHQDRWEQAVALLTIGVSPERAFSFMADAEGLGEVAHLVEVSHRSGSALGQGCRRIAESLSATAADHRTAAAERAGVYIALPLATCFLPAFMILGLAPVVLGLGMKVLGHL